MQSLQFYANWILKGSLFKRNVCIWNAYSIEK